MIVMRMVVAIIGTFFVYALSLTLLSLAGAYALGEDRVLYLTLPIDGLAAFLGILAGASVFAGTRAMTAAALLSILPLLVVVRDIVRVTSGTATFPMWSMLAEVIGTLVGVPSAYLYARRRMANVSLLPAVDP